MSDAIELLTRLVSFPTLSRRSNLDLIDFVEDYLSGYGVAARRCYSPDGTRANLYATIGPNSRGGICLSGHSDVVPTEGQPWNSDPFALTARENRLYGRGSADMKGYLACVLAMTPHFIQATRRADALPVHIAISYDEEIGCVGVRGLLDQLAHDEARPISCIIGEPTMMRIATAHKGKSAWKCRVQGQAAHSSQNHLGVNAIDYAAELVLFLRNRGVRFRHEGVDARYDPPWSTVQVGVISGGSAVNVVPDRCEFEFEIRPLPQTGHDNLATELTQFAQELITDMRRVSPGADIRLEPQSAYPGLQDDGSLEALKRRCAGALGQDTFDSLSFGTEAGLFQQAGIPTVVCGPGSITVAHKADEYVTVEQLELCQSFLARVVGG